MEQHSLCRSIWRSSSDNSTGEVRSLILPNGVRFLRTPFSYATFALAKAKTYVNLMADYISIA